MALFPERIARHGKKRSLISLDPFNNKAVWRVALQDDEKFGVPLRIVNRVELMDRTSTANLLGDGAPVPTTLKVLKVDGVAEMMERRSSEYVELE